MCFLLVIVLIVSTTACGGNSAPVDKGDEETKGPEN